MDEIKETTEETKEEASKEAVEAAAEKLKQASLEAQEALVEGKGRLKLDTPIHAGDQDIDELPYDFTRLTGMEYVECMDNDSTNAQIFRITYKQGLNLFAAAAAKECKAADKRDILEKIGVSDSIKASQVAMLFFNVQSRAGNMRILKK